MELQELENIWKECDRKVTENNRINKEILRKMLVHKPERIINWIEIKSGLNLLSPFILFALVTITNYQFHFISGFYIGWGLLIPVYIITYIWDLKYFLQIHNLDLSDTTLNIKKKITILEKHKVKVTQVRYMLIPIAITGLLLIFCPSFIFNIELIIMLLLIVVVFISSAYYRFYSIRERFRILNKEIEEIERMEKE